MAEEPKRQRRAPETVEAVFVLVVLALIVGAGFAGWITGKASRSPLAAAETPPGHTGAALLAEAFGDPVRGKLLFEEKACVDCHSYAGRGGEDGPGARLHARPPLGA